MHVWVRRRSPRWASSPSGAILDAAGALLWACAGEAFGQLVLPAVFKTDVTE